MAEWKTMREVAQELGVSKRVIKYHKEKLGLLRLPLKMELSKYHLKGWKK